MTGPFAAGVAADGSNLVARAIAAFRKVYPESDPASWELEKHLPHGAGLGGGSSDAAAALRLAEQAHGTPPPAGLAAMAATIGSDCAFFVYDWPAATASGRGELLEPLPMKPVPALLVWPGFAISTREAYADLAPGDMGSRSDLVALAAWMKDPGGTPPPRTANAFERSASERHPVIASILKELRGMGAAMAHLSGSGSACFGLFPEGRDLTQARKRIEAVRLADPNGPNWWIRETMAGV